MLEEYDSRGRSRKYISGHYKYWLGKERSEGTKKKISDSLTGRKQSTETIEKRKASLRKKYFKIEKVKPGHRKGSNHPGWKGGLPHCIDCGKKLSVYNAKRCYSCYWKSLKGRKLSREAKRKAIETLEANLRRGENHPNWKGGITPENKKIRKSNEYKEWRRKVFERDNYTCQRCQIRGGYLHPHHIKPFASHPELRFDVNNGITLCKKCHKAIHRRERKQHRAVSIF